MKKGTKKQPELYWDELVHEWFYFYRIHFGMEPHFDGSAPRNLKNIVKALKERAESKEVEWTMEAATTRLRYFFEYAFKDQWLKKNWLLQNLDRQKDKIFFGGKVSNS